MTAPPSLGREERFLTLLSARFASQDAQVRHGIGDDAAIIASPHAPLALTVDTQVEDVHFRKGYLSWRALGRRAYIVSVSDLAAMGAKPYAALAALTLPPYVDDAMFTELCDGMAEAATDIGAPIVGGNLSGGTLLSLTMTLVGSMEGEGLQRTGARPEHRIYVTGTLGAAALGLYCLEHGESSAAAQPFIERWRHPHARIAEGLKLNAVASAAIDLSDGLSMDLQRLCSSSSVGAKIYSERLPLEPGHRAMSQQLGLDSASVAIHGGEDYELLYTCTDDRGIAAQLGTCIGEITKAQGVQFLDAEGRALKLAAPTYGAW